MSFRSKSNIAQLPEEIQAYINQLLHAGVTYKDILAKLEELGIDSVSRSGLGRHCQELQKQAERHNRAIAIAQRFLDSAEQKGKHTVLEGGVQMLGSLLIEIAQELGEDEKPTARDVNFYAQALKNLVGATKGVADMSINEAKALVEQGKAEADTPTDKEQAVHVEVIKAAPVADASDNSTDETGENSQGEQ